MGAAAGGRGSTRAAERSVSAKSGYKAAAPDIRRVACGRVDMIGGYVVLHCIALHLCRAGGGELSAVSVVRNNCAYSTVVSYNAHS